VRDIPACARAPKWPCLCNAVGALGVGISLTHTAKTWPLGCSGVGQDISLSPAKNNKIKLYFFLVYFLKFITVGIGIRITSGIFLYFSLLLCLLVDIANYNNTRWVVSTCH
jgi:hypothetical protein